MTLKESRQAYYDYSAKASEINRQLGFAGLAIVWIFKAGSGEDLIIPTALILGAFFVVSGLALDLLHYSLSAAIWGGFSRYHEWHGRSKFTAPRWINWPALIFFWAKIGLMILGYVCIFSHLIEKLLEIPDLKLP